jgi:hypothetical protein
MHCCSVIQGDKNIIKFDGDHNSPRPQFYYDSITIFFYNVLRPPDAPVIPEVPEPIYFDDALDMDDVDEVHCPASYILTFPKFTPVIVGELEQLQLLKWCIVSHLDFGMSHFLDLNYYRIPSMRYWGQYDHLPLPTLSRLLLVVAVLMVLYGTYFISMFMSLMYLFRRNPGTNS